MGRLTADSGDDGKTSSSESGIILKASSEVTFSMLSCGDLSEPKKPNWAVRDVVASLGTEGHYVRKQAYVV